MRANRFFSQAALFCISLIMAATLSQSRAEAATEIEWELENGFRMFLKPKHTRMHREEYEKLSEEEKKAPILNIERRLGQKYPKGWASGVYEYTCWDRKKARYHRCRKAKKDYLHPKAHKVLAYLSDRTSLTGTCKWGVYSKSGKTLQEQKRNCNEQAKLSIPYPEGAIVRVSAGKVLYETSIRVKDLFIVGIGDSFASGEGNPDEPVTFNEKRFADYGKIPQGGARLNHFPARVGKWKWIGDRRHSSTKARWNNRPCHRSLYSHQLRAALQLTTENKKLAVTYAGFSCSGAEALVGLLDFYKGNEWDIYKHDTSQISAAARAMCGPNEAPFNTYTTTFTYGGRFPTMENLGLYRCDRRGNKSRKIDILLLSIGGNDVGFSRLVANAILKDKTALKSLGGWMGQIYKYKHAIARLDELEWRYKAINRAFHNILHIPWSQSDRIILTAYPKIGYKEDGTTICPDGPKGMDLHPLFKVDADRVEQGEKFSEALFISMHRHAKNFGWSFVWKHREQFARHGYCAVSADSPDRVAETLAIPKMKGNKEWAPYSPVEFRAYVPRQRWIRTPNDVFMATNLHIKRRLLGKVFKMKNLNPFQLIYAGTYGGSFHPTAEGQAAIADAVTQKIHSVLKKYKY